MGNMVLLVASVTAGVTTAGNTEFRSRPQPRRLVRIPTVLVEPVHCGAAVCLRFVWLLRALLLWLPLCGRRCVVALCAVSHNRQSNGRAPASVQKLE